MFNFENKIFSKANLLLKKQNHKLVGQKNYLIKKAKTQEVQIGIALGSGGARGITHIGVLKAIEEKGIKLHYISGASIGALIGAAYSLGIPLSEIEDIALQTDWKTMAKIFQPSFSLHSLVNTNYLSEFLSTWFGNKTFNDLIIPFSAVASDIHSGKLYVFEKGDLITAIRASISIPVIFSPVIIGNHILVDGGLMNPTPVDIVRKKKVDKIIAVNLRRLSSIGIQKNKVMNIENSNEEIKGLSLNEKIQYFLKHPLNYWNTNEKQKNPNLKFWNVLYQMYLIAQTQISDLTMQSAKPDVIIEPDTSNFKASGFNKAKDLIEIGYSSAMRELENFQITPISNLPNH